MKRSIAVLCVDADGFGLQVRRMVLESFGCTVLASTDANDALALLATEKLDVVLMDNSVDGMSGVELAQTIKSRQPALPVLMLSNLVYPPECALPYIDGFATKGDSPRALMTMIEKSVRASRRPTSGSEKTFWAVGGLALTSAVVLVSKFVDRSRNRKRENDSDSEADRAVAQAQDSLVRTRAAHA